jgi:hypothetical protein
MLTAGVETSPSIVASWRTTIRPSALTRPLTVPAMSIA